MPFSLESMTRITDAYRKLRNTLRFLLSNLYDFDPARHAVAADRLLPIDAHFLRRGRDLARRIEGAYRSYEFHVVYHALNNFCNVDLSAVYLDFLKDRLYCSHPDDAARRSAQTVLWRVAHMLTTAVAPVLAFTADEVWEHLPGVTLPSVHLAELDLVADAPDGAEADAAFGRLLLLRDEIYRELEVHRQAGEFGKGLEAAVALAGDRTALAADLSLGATSLEELCIVSQVAAGDGDVESAAYPGLRFAVRRAEGTACPRCWQVHRGHSGDERHPELCARCLDVVLRLERERQQ
jgi:isoleucyl-tRNA synthetase